MPDNNKALSASSMPYGDAIQQAIASGDLAKMKTVAAQAQKYVNNYGDVAAALEALKIEIAKVGAKKLMN